MLLPGGLSRLGGQGQSTSALSCRLTYTAFGVGGVSQKRPLDLACIAEQVIR